MSHLRANLDLVVLVADKNMEAAVRGLLGRTQSLKVRAISYVTYVHPHRDPGCLLEAAEFLRPFQRQFARALVMFDRHGSGQEQKEREVLETEVEDRLRHSGWADRASAICIDPELESWVWSSSPEVAFALGWDSPTQLRSWLQEKGLWGAGCAKPAHPKAAVEAALREVRIPRSSAIYQRLAERVSLAGCTDPAFGKLRTVLRSWFGKQPFSDAGHG